MFYAPVYVITLNCSGISIVLYVEMLCDSQRRAMALGTKYRRASSWVRAMNIALIFIFAARALIPTGYMPDFSSLSKGTLSVVICSGSGLKTVLLDQDGKPLPTHDQSDHHHPCAFTGLAAITVTDFAPLAFAQWFNASAAVWFEKTSPALHRIGPPLGSRGPPMIA